MTDLILYQGVFSVFAYILIRHFILRHLLESAVVIALMNRMMSDDEMSELEKKPREMKIHYRVIDPTYRLQT